MVDILPEHPPCRAFQRPPEMRYTICLCFNYYKNTPHSIHFRDPPKYAIWDVSSPSSISLLGPVHLHHTMHFGRSLKCAIWYMLKVSDMITNNTHSNNRSWSIVVQGMFQLLDTSIMIRQTFQNPKWELNIVHEVHRHSLQWYISLLTGPLQVSHTCFLEVVSFYPDLHFTFLHLSHIPIVDSLFFTPLYILFLFEWPQNFACGSILILCYIVF